MEQLTIAPLLPAHLAQLNAFMQFQTPASDRADTIEFLAAGISSVDRQGLCTPALLNAASNLPKGIHGLFDHRRRLSSSFATLQPTASTSDAGAGKFGRWRNARRWHSTSASTTAAARLGEQSAVTSPCRMPHRLPGRLYLQKIGLRCAHLLPHAVQTNTYGSDDMS